MEETYLIISKLDHLLGEDEGEGRDEGVKEDKNDTFLPGVAARHHTPTHPSLSGGSAGHACSTILYFPLCPILADKFI